MCGVFVVTNKALPKVDGVRCKTGSAVITTGGDLDATHVIHAVGPDYNMFDESDYGACDDLLSSAYRSTLEVARESDIKTLGVCLISAGIFRGSRSLAQVLDIAVQSAAAGAYEGLEELHLVAFTPAEVETLVGLVQESDLLR